MSQRQRRRRRWARLKAQAEGRVWQTGDSHRATVQMNRRPAEVGYTLPDLNRLAIIERDSLAGARRAARGSAIWQSVKTVDVPDPVRSTFRRSI